MPRALILALLLADALALPAAAGDVVWKLTEDARYLVQITEVDGRPAAFLRNATGTWSRTAPQFVEAMRAGLVVELDGNPVKVVPVEGVAPAPSGTAGSARELRVSLHGSELARIQQVENAAFVRSERTLTAFDVRSFASDAAYAERFKPSPRYRVDPRTTARTDLHTHLAGHLEFESLVKMASEHNVKYPTALLDRIGVRYPAAAVVDGKISFLTLTASPEFKASHGMAALEDAMTIEKSTIRTFLDMEEKYAFRNPITKDQTLFKDMLWEAARSSKRSGVNYIEPFLSNIIDPDWLRVANAEVPRIEKELGVKVRFVASMWRHSDPEWNLDEMKKLKRILPSTPYIVGADFMGHETNSTKALEAQVKAAAELRAMPGFEDFQVNVHAGENPLNPGNVREAAEFGATRVGHGLYIDKDAAAMRLDPYTQKIDAAALDALAKSKVVIQLNPSSNQALNNLSGGSDVLHQQFRQFKAAGIPVTFGTDGMGMYGVDHREIERMMRSLGFTHEDLVYVRQSERAYVERVEASTRRRAAAIKASGVQVPTQLELEAAVDAAGRQYTPALAAERAAASAARLAEFHTDLAAKGISPFDRAAFEGMKVIDLSGGSKSQFDALAKEGKLADMKIPEIQRLFRDMLDRLDPDRVFFMTGGTQFGVEKILHEEVAAHNATVDKKFRVVGVVPLEANVAEIHGPGRAGITDYVVGGKTWADFSRAKLDLLRDFGGVKMAIGGKMFVADEFRYAINSQLPFQTLYLDGPVGAGSDLARENPRGAFKNADELFAKLADGESAGILRPTRGVMIPPAEPLTKTAAEIEEIFKAKNKTVVTFAGYSGAGYENPERMLADARGRLMALDPKTAVVNIGGTEEGIGAVYKLAKQMGFETTGIVSSKARGAAKLSPHADQIFFVEDPTWGGRQPNGELSPTSRAIVGSSHEFVVIGGGEIAGVEAQAAREARKPVTFFPADMDHAAAIAKAQAAGKPVPTAFHGAAHEAITGQVPRTLPVAGGGRVNQACVQKLLAGLASGALK